MIYDRIRNTKKNIIFGSILKILTVLFPFFISTIIVRTLGIEYIGLSGLFSAILTVLNVSELGFGSAVTFSMYSLLANDDYKKINVFLNYYRIVYAIIALFIFIAGLLVIPFLKQLIKTGVPKDINVYFLYIIFLFNSITSYIFGSYKKSILHAMQKDYIIYIITFITQFFIYIFQILALILIQSYYLYASLLIVGNIINNCVSSLYVSKKYSFVKPEGILPKSERRIIRQKIFGLLINRLLSVIRNSSVTIFVTAFLGLAANGIYSNYLMIVTTIISIMLMLANSITGGIGNSLQLKTENENFHDFTVISIIYMFFSCICILGTYNFYQIFISLFYGSKYLLDSYTKNLFCVLLFFFSVIPIRNIYINASGLWDKTKKYALMDMFCNIILNFIGVSICGTSGIIIATIISVFIFDFMFISQRFFKEVFPNSSVKSYWKNYILCGLAIILLIIIFSPLELFFKNRLLCSLISFFAELVTFVFVSYFLCRKNTYFNDSRILLLSMIK